MKEFKTDNVELYNMDCMELMKQYPDNHFDLAIVDPPYGIDAGKMTMGSGKHKFKKGKDWDSSIPDSEYFNELFRVSKNQIVWGGNYFTEHLPPTPHWLVWDKKNPNLSFAEGELAWVRDGKNLRIFQHYSAKPDEWYGKVHPTQKPIQLYKYILMNYAKPNFKILDTHLGSGSIAIAVHNVGGHLTASELDADYFQASVKRFKQVTAQTSLF